MQFWYGRSCPNTIFHNFDMLFGSLYWIFNHPTSLFCSFLARLVLGLEA
jgi:hypothetical protein